MLFCVFATLAAWVRYHHVFSEDAKKRGVQQYVNLDTMLPWWGNDALYEDNVKRIFLEEYRKGRQAAEQIRHYEAGMEEEGKSATERSKRELAIFEVSPTDVRRMRDRVIYSRANPVEDTEEQPPAATDKAATA